MLARWMESEERKALAVPVREQVDQGASRQHWPHAPADDLSDARSGEALFAASISGSVKVSGPLVGTSIDSSPRMNSQSNGRPGVEIEKLQTAMAGEIRGVRRPAVPLEIARRSHGQDRRLDQFARNKRREMRTGRSGWRGRCHRRPDRPHARSSRTRSRVPDSARRRRRGGPQAPAAGRRDRCRP